MIGNGYIELNLLLVGMESENFLERISLKSRTLVAKIRYTQFRWFRRWSFLFYGVWGDG